MSLKNTALKNSYVDLLQLGNSNNGITTSVAAVKDGAGQSSCISISDDSMLVRPVNDNTSSSLLVRTKAGANVLEVNTSDILVKASGNFVNTQYATFNTVAANSSSFVAGYHYPLLFKGSDYNDSTNLPHLSNGTDPETSKTFSNTNTVRAADWVPLMWYVNDDISIDAIKSIEGADAATGDATRMHLFSYDFTSGSSSALTNGTLLGHNSDVTNAGCEQAYLSTWTVDSAAVTSGKIILATFESDAINSDYSLQVIVKYHLT